MTSHSTTWIAAAAVMVLTIAGTATAGPAELSPEVRALAKRLAQAEPTQSCAADGAMMSSGSPLYATSSALGVSALGGSKPLSVGGSGLWVQCSLAFTNGKPGGDCEGKHTMNWQVFSGGTVIPLSTAGLKVSAELLALDVNGNVLNSFGVKQGETVQMNSRLSPDDWKFRKGKGTYDVFAPVPMLKVTAEFGGDTTDAYCTSIPYVDLIKPDGGVVTDSTGGGIDFKAAVPRTSPGSLALKVDGTNILPLILAQEPSGCPFNLPCEGTLAAPPISYSNLIIDVAPSVQTMASNTISGTLSDLGCGEHIVRVTGSADPAFRRTSVACNLDDLTDKGSASFFDIQLTELGDKTGNDLVAGLITNEIPTDVKGLICGGTDILSANVNGKELDVSGQQKVLGDGENSGDVVTLAIDTALAQTDLVNDFKGLTTALGTFAPGSNRLLIAATEAEKGARAYERLMFAIGNNIKPLGIDASAVFNTSEVSVQTQQMVQQAVQQKLQGILGPSETTIKNAFVVALSEEGAQTILQNLCDAKIIPDPDDANIKLSTGEFFDKVVTKTLTAFDYEHPFTTFTFGTGIPCVCNTDVHVFLDQISVGDQVSCPIEFFDGEIHVSLQLPDVDFRIHAIGPEESCAVPIPLPPFVAPSTTSVDAWATVGFHDVTFTYKLTEQDILDETTTKAPDAFQLNTRTDFASGGGPEYGVASDICNYFLIGFVDVLTFGGVNLEPLLYPNLDFDKTIDFKANLAPAEPNAIPMKGFNIEEQTDGIYHQKLQGDINAVSDIHITGPDGQGKGAGITVGLKGTFSTTMIDPFVEGNPGFQAIEPDLPTLGDMQAQGAKDALVGLSTDTINMFFESLGSNGEMRVPNSDEQGCFATGLTVGSLLPANCESIDLDPNTASAIPPPIDDVANGLARAYCHAFKGDNCATFSSTLVDPVLISGERGACFGASGKTDDECWTLSNGDGVLYLACVATPDLHIHADQNFMFCATGDIPVLKLPTAAANTVPTDLQINDISVALVLDRGLNGTPNGQVDGLLNALPGCFSGTQTNADCNILSACLDVNMFFTINSLQPGNQVCPDGKAGLQAGFTDIIPHLRKLGEVCEGSSTATTDDDSFDKAATEDAVSKPIGQNAAAFAPPICGTGLSVPQLFTCDSVAVLGLDTAVQPGFREFLALTCDIH